MDVETGLLERKFVLKPLRAFDIPDAEDFAYVKERIGVAVLGLDFSNLLRVTDAARNDAVNQCGAEEVLLVDPFLEIFAELPVVDVPVDDLLKLLAVVVDELAGENDNALLAGLEALIKEHGQLGREGCRRNLLKGGFRIVDNAGFRRVGGNILKVSGLRDLLDGFPVFIRIVACVADGDHALAVDLLAVLGAAEIQRIEAFLLVDELR